MQITRVYHNAAGDAIRVDEVSVDVLPPAPVLFPRIGNDPGLQMRIGPQKIHVQPIHETGATRTVSTIKITGDYDDVEAVSGDYTWATVTLGSGQIVRYDMSNLPGVGDTV